MELDFIDSVVSPEFMHIVSPFNLFRVQSAGERYYMMLDENNKPTYYLSVTSFCSKSLGASAFLMKNYFGVLGTEQAELNAEIAAHYGTMLHIEIGNFFKNDYQYDFGNSINDALLSVCAKYLQENNLHHSLAYEWREKLQNDMASFISWVQEKNVKMIAMEFRIASDTYKVGGAIDLICSLDFDGKRVFAVVDFKSGRKGFFDSHILQLKAYATIWNEHYKNVCPITHCFNWSPKEWREKPTYNFENQTKKPIDFKSRAEVAIKEEWVKTPKSYLVMSGVANLSKPINDLISIVEPHQPYIKNA
jgi:hypothetical protein